MLNFKTFPIAILCLCMNAAAINICLAQDRHQEAKLDSHPAIPVFPGFKLETSKVQEFGAFKFQTANGEKAVEGKTWELNYMTKEGVKGPSGLEVIRNYENAFKKKGGTVVFSDPGEGAGTFKMPSAGGGEIWLYVLASGSEGEYIDMNIVETKAMVQRVELSSDQMAQQLAQSGHVALYGIQFETGKAAIKPDSAKVLDEVAKLLAGQAGLKLRIEGHTDNVGGSAQNKKLSDERAAAVKAWLVGHNASAANLTTAGLGDTKPVADNSTESGRAKNRRVELVKQ